MASDRDFIPELIEKEPEGYPDQPPEVDPEADPANPRSLPDLAAAAARIREFVGEWGDGRIETAGGAHLYARDLEVVARHAQRERAGYGVTIADELCDRYSLPMPVYARLSEARRQAGLSRRADGRVVELYEVPDHG